MSNFAWWMIFILLGLYIARAIQLYLRNRKYKPKPWFTLPIIGDNYRMVYQLDKFIDERAKYNSDTRARTALFGLEVLITGNPNDVKQVFSAPSSVMDQFVYPTAKLLERGSIAAEIGEPHDMLRKPIEIIFKPMYEHLCSEYVENN